jgi:hypothetical protein
VQKKDAVNPRRLAAARTRLIFGLRRAQPLTQAEYLDYLSWVHIMIDVERKRLAQRVAMQPLMPVTDREVMDLDDDMDDEAAISEAPAAEVAA